MSFLLVMKMWYNSKNVRSKNDNYITITFKKKLISLALEFTLEQRRQSLLIPNFARSLLLVIERNLLIYEKKI